MKGIKYKYSLYFFMLLMCLGMYSNNITDPPLPKPDGPGPYPEFPIDAGLSYLFIVGVAYGVYAIRKRVRD